MGKAEESTNIMLYFNKSTGLLQVMFPFSLAFLFPEVDYIAQVQCTSPCLHPFHVAGPCRMMREEGFDSVFAVTRRHGFRWQEVHGGIVTHNALIFVEFCKVYNSIT